MNRRQRLVQRLFANIQAELAPWQDGGISLEMVERTYCSAFQGGFVDGSFRLQIVGGEWFVVGEIAGYAEFNRHVKLFLLDVARHHKLPDVDLVLSTADACHPPGALNGSTARCPRLAPLLAYSRRPGDTHCVTYPDHTFAGWPTVNLPSWQDLWDVMGGKEQAPWRSRRDGLFFRGAKTGNRAWLADNAAFVADPRVDVRFSRWTGDPDAPFTSLPEHCGHRYLLHLPGQAYSARVKMLLLCKSTVIFPRGSDDPAEFWYHLLQNGTNVIMPPGLTWDGGGRGVLAALEALQNEPARAEAVAAAGHELARRALRPDNVRRYFAELISTYASLQRFHPSRHPDAVPFHVSVLRPDRNTTQAGRTCTVCR